MTFLHVLEGENVCDALWVVLDPAVSGEVSHHVHDSFSSIFVDNDGLVDGLNVG